MFAKRIYTRISFTLLACIVGVLSAATYASAATINFRPDSGSYNIGDTVSVRVYVSTDSQSINAVSATVKFTSDILTLSSIHKSGSIINLWAQDPTYSNSDGTATFEGVILNGYVGSSGTAVTLSFKAKKPGTATITFTNAAILANDGNGTDITTGKGNATFTIGAKTQAVQTQKSESTDLVLKAPVKDTTIALSLIKNQDPKDTTNRFLVTSVQKVKDSTYMVQIDAQSSSVWFDDGTHTYIAPILPRGNHTITVTAVGTAGDALSGSASFYSRALAVPVINPPKDIYTDQILVFSGTADPLVDVIVSVTNKKTGEVFTYPTKSNALGTFTFVGSQAYLKGEYIISATAATDDGITSGPMTPLPLTVRTHWFDAILAFLNKYLILLLPVVVLLSLSIGFGMYSYYKLRYLQQYLSKRLSKATTLIDKSFELLGEDVAEEIAIFRKIKANKPLDKEEQAFLSKFKKDIEAAQKLISKEVKDISK